MKTIILALFSSFILSQRIEPTSLPKDITNHLPKNLMIMGENVNLRSQPNKDSKILDHLVNSEFITLLDFVKSKDSIYISSYQLEESWLKVKRNKTDQIGYVFGKYIQPQNMVYLSNSDCNWLQPGYWYGILQKNYTQYIKKIKPHLEKIGKIHSVIKADSGEYSIYICSQIELKENIIKSNIMWNERQDIRIGSHLKLLQSVHSDFDLMCTGEYTFKFPYLARNNEKLFLMKTIKDRGGKYSTQELTDYLMRYGDVGYHLIFAGDINGDGTPELILSEADNHGTVNYFVFDGRKYSFPYFNGTDPITKSGI